MYTEDGERRWERIDDLMKRLIAAERDFWGDAGFTEERLSVTLEAVLRLVPAYILPTVSPHWTPDHVRWGYEGSTQVESDGLSDLHDRLLDLAMGWAGEMAARKEDAGC